MEEGRPARWLAGALLSLAVGAWAAPARAQARDVGPADDAYHFPDWADGRHDATYTEWWYFNFDDPDSGLQAIFSYFVLNPGDRFGAARVQMVAVAYTPEGVVSAVDLHPVETFLASVDRADVAIGEAAVSVITDDVYRIAGASRDGRLSWDLTYDRQAASWFAADRMAVGIFPWERMSWLLYMPRARVTGRMAVDGREYAVNAPGYHDHNWGEWIPAHALWNWAQYSSPRVVFDMGVFIDRPVGVVGLEVDGERAEFVPGQYDLRHTRWAWDGDNRVFYPTESVLIAESDRARLTVTIRAIATEALRGDLPRPLRDVIIYEQTARFDGRLWTRSPAGDWVPAARFRGGGFKEYTARRF